MAEDDDKDYEEKVRGHKELARMEEDDSDELNDDDWRIGEWSQQDWSCDVLHDATRLRWANVGLPANHVESLGMLLTASPSRMAGRHLQGSRQRPGPVCAV